jgi:hypothetical protein
MNDNGQAMMVAMMHGLMFRAQKDPYYLNPFLIKCLVLPRENFIFVVVVGASASVC